MELPEEVGRDVRRLDEVFRSQRALATKLEAVTELVERIVPACDAASVSLIVADAMFTGAASSQLAIEADLVQYGVDEGPCLASAEERSVVRIDVLAHDERFEHFAPGAVERGVASVLSIPLGTDERSVGSLNLYSRTPQAFTDETAAPLGDLVAYATDLIAPSPMYEASVEALRRLVETVHLATQVEIAVGMLIVMGGLAPVAAWDRLRDLAAEDGVSIVERARRLVEDHERSLEPPDEAI